MTPEDGAVSDASRKHREVATLPRCVPGRDHRGGGCLPSIPNVRRSDDLMNRDNLWAEIGNSQTRPSLSEKGIRMHGKILTAFYFAVLFHSFMSRGDVRADGNNGQNMPNPDQLLPRLLEGWQQLQKWDETEKEYQVDASVKSLSSKAPSESLYQIRIKPPCWSCSGQSRANGPGIEINCQSPYYIFAIFKKTNESKNDWVLGNFDKIDPQRGFHAFFFGPNKSDLFYPLSSFGAKRLHEIASGGFAVTKVRASAMGKLRVDFNHLVKGQKGEGKVAGWMIVDPDRSYVVLDSRRTSSLVPNREFVIQRELEEARDAPGGFRCKSYEFQAVSLAAKEVEQRIRHQYHDFSYRPIAEESFRLSHYGLPEPADAPPVNSWGKMLWLWIILAALVLAAAAVGLRRLAQRSRKPGD